ncbi:uncharacterized protein METZ01_LOCUS86064 [marine metagenome]|uniref:Uncharacterized protein n=1 Tax=marine metagenome TaxID=408172 RepID=A0A381UYN1_9ZZZZ
MKALKLFGCDDFGLLPAVEDLLLALFNACTRLDAGFVRIVFARLRIILAPTLPLVRFIVILALILGEAKHCAIFLTILPLRRPTVQRNFRTTFCPDRPQICFSSRWL